MHVVECPNCRRKFKVPQPVANVQMKCSRCGTAFLGSSSSAPDDASEARPAEGQWSRPAAPVAFGPPGAPLAPVRRSSSGPGPILLAATVLMVIGLIVIAIVGLRRLQSRTNPKTGQVISKEVVRTEEAERPAAEERARNPHPPGDPSNPSVRRPEQRPTPTTATGPVRPPDGPVNEPIPGSDPKLAVNPPDTFEPPAGQDRFAFGFVRSNYDVALEYITVRLYVDGVPGTAETYLWVPPGGKIRYCLTLGSGQAKVEVRAHAKPAASNVLVWEIPQDTISRSRTSSNPDTVAYTGKFQNNYAVQGTDVEVYVDYFDKDGYGKRAPRGRLDEAKPVGVGKFGQVVFEIPKEDVEVVETFVARAKGVKY